MLTAIIAGRQLRFYAKHSVPFIIVDNKNYILTNASTVCGDKWFTAMTRLCFHSLRKEGKASRHEG